MRLKYFVLSALIRHVCFGNAQVLSYMTAVVTECVEVPEDGHTSKAQTSSAAQLSPETVTYSMPRCDACDCSTCTTTSTFTTTFPVFCPTGLSDQPYTVIETYVGMSSLPSFAASTPIPYGFSITTATCTICGRAPLVATLTYPSGGTPYATGVSSGVWSPNQVPFSDAPRYSNQSSTLCSTVHATVYTTLITVPINTSQETTSLQDESSRQPVGLTEDASGTQSATTGNNPGTSGASMASSNTASLMTVPLSWAFITSLSVVMHVVFAGLV